MFLGPFILVLWFLGVNRLSWIFYVEPASDDSLYGQCLRVITLFFSGTVVLWSSCLSLMFYRYSGILRI